MDRVTSYACVEKFRVITIISKSETWVYFSMDYKGQ
jgi:hypothetical protein